MNTLTLLSCPGKPGPLYERFADSAPAQVHATLLEEGSYLCAPRTMYRILAESNEIRERRDKLQQPHYTRPELVATAPK